MARATLAVLAIMVHIFFNRIPRGKAKDSSSDVSRCSRDTRLSATRSSGTDTLEDHTAFENWCCEFCDFSNRSLRSSQASKVCSNCHNDFVYKLAPRKNAHRKLIEERPVQVRVELRFLGSRRRRPNVDITDRYCLKNRFELRTA
jgi:hypothetical protein